MTILQQMFRSSLPVGRVLEDPFDLPPVILCYKLNGQWLNSERGGPVRMVVPEAYGFKSVKWLTHVVISNLYHANDTYANGNNDVDSPLKTFAATLSVPREVKAGQPIAVTGYAQVGISGSVESSGLDCTGCRTTAGWRKALRDRSVGRRPAFAAAGKTGAETCLRARFRTEPWASTPQGGLHPGPCGWPKPIGPRCCRACLPEITFCAVAPSMKRASLSPCRAPFRKSGHSAIETVSLTVVA